MTAVIIGTLIPSDSAEPAAIGVSATIVPTLVPIDSDMKQAARNNPARSMFAGSKVSVRFMVASTHPMTFAVLANAPASMNIHIMSIMFEVLAPRLKMSIRRESGMPPPMTTA